jgi:hypothetical protein
MNITNLIKCKTLLFLFLLSTYNTGAQENNIKEKEDTIPIKIGAKIGFSLGNLSSNNDNIYAQNFESTSGIDFGLTFEFEITDMISIQPEVNYTQRGGKRTGLQPISANELRDQLNQFLPFIGMPLITDENPLYATFDSESDLSYLEIPVLVKFGWGDDFRFYGEIGPYLGVLLSANQITNGNSQFYFDSQANTPVIVPNPSGNPPFVQLPPESLTANTTIKDDLRTVNFGGIVGIGMSKKINQKGEISIDARAAYGFNAIQFNEVFGESHIGGVVFSLGYAYQLP